MSPFTALVLIPLVFAIILVATGQVQDVNIGTLIRQGLFGNNSKDKLTAMKGTAETGIMLLFAILYFSTMLDAGLFDPITNKMIRFAKGDPMKVLMATAIVAAAVSLNGDGTTTTLICCSAFVPIYKKLDMKLMNLGVLVILQNTIMNLLPWGRTYCSCDVSSWCRSRYPSLLSTRYDSFSSLRNLLCCSLNG